MEATPHPATAVGVGCCDSRRMTHISPSVRVRTAAIRAVHIAATDSIVRVDESAAVDVIRRVEAVSERAPEEAVTGQPRIGIQSGVPEPSRVEAGLACIALRELLVGLAEILGAQLAPVVQRVVLGVVVVAEALRLFVRRGERQDVVAFHLDRLRLSAGRDLSLAIEYADVAGVGSELV